MQKVKRFFSENKHAVTSSVAAMALMVGTSAFAAEETVGIDPAIVVGAFTKSVNSTLTLMAALLPIGLGVFATVWGVRKAIRFFKATTN